MKWLFLLVVVGALIAFVFWWGSTLAEPRIGFQVAYGPPENDEIVMEAIMASAMTTKDPDNYEQNWIDEHVQLIDSSGELVTIRYRNACSLPSLAGSMGSQEVGYMHAVLIPGNQYTFRARPELNGPWYKTIIIAPNTDVSARVLTLKQID